MNLKALFLIIYYVGGTLALFVGSFMAGGWPYLLITIGTWAILSAFADRSWV